MSEPRTFFTCDEGTERLSCLSASEAVQDWLEDFEEGTEPETVEVFEFRARVVTTEHIRDFPLDRLLEYLDEEYGDPDGDYTEPNEAMRDANKAFIAAVLKEYRVWTCEKVGSQTVKVAEYQ